MPKFSQRSRAKLETCHEDLQMIFNEVIWMRDCTIIEGYRGKARQNELFFLEKSQVRFPHSRHNHSPSMAVDVMEYHDERPHIHWFELDEIEVFARFVMEIADGLRDRADITHRLRWGGDWDNDGVRVDRDPDEWFFDAPHFELVEN